MILANTFHFATPANLPCAATNNQLSGNVSVLMYKATDKWTHILIPLGTVHNSGSCFILASWTLPWVMHDMTCEDHMWHKYWEDWCLDGFWPHHILGLLHDWIDWNVPALLLGAASAGMSMLTENPSRSMPRDHTILIALTLTYLWGFGGVSCTIQISRERVCRECFTWSSLFSVWSVVFSSWTAWSFCIKLTSSSSSVMQFCKHTFQLSIVVHDLMHQYQQILTTKHTPWHRKIKSVLNQAWWKGEALHSRRGPTK